MLLGVDFGSKMAGTTVICYQMDDKLVLKSSEKSKNADLFLQEQFLKLQATKVFIDAPLSLPGAYYGKTDNYHFRVCDIETQAMSPMFLGGLTARAIKLKDSCGEIEFFESYPSFLMKTICSTIKEIYTKKQKLSDQSIEWLKSQVGLAFENEPSNWHEFDATLAWLTGRRYMNNEALKIGNDQEGIIWI